MESAEVKPAQVRNSFMLSVLCLIRTFLRETQSMGLFPLAQAQAGHWGNCSETLGKSRIRQALGSAEHIS